MLGLTSSTDSSNAATPTTANKNSSSESGKTWLDVLAKVKAEEEAKQKKKQQQQNESDNNNNSSNIITAAALATELKQQNDDDDDNILCSPSKLSLASTDVIAPLPAPPTIDRISHSTLLSASSSLEPDRASISNETAFTFDTASSWATDDDCFLDAVFRDNNTQKSQKKEKPWRVVDTRRPNARVTFVDQPSSGGAIGGASGGSGGSTPSGGGVGGASGSSNVASTISSRFDSLFRKGK